MNMNHQMSFCPKGFVMVGKMWMLGEIIQELWLQMLVINSVT